MQSNSNIEINGRYSFDIKGLAVIYTYKNEITRLTLCPKATCQLLQDAKLIEGFDLDENNEPVILFTDSTLPAGYGFDRWHSFVRGFKISQKIVEKLMEYREDQKASRVFQATVNYLLQTLKAA